MSYEHLPHLPGVGKELAAAIIWFGEPKNPQVVEYLNALDAKIGEFREQAALLGKAEDIERLHGEAMDLKASVLAEIEKREAALAAAKTAFDDGMKESRRKLAADIADAQAKAVAMQDEASAAQKAAKAMEAETAAAREAAQKAEAEAVAARDAVQATRAELQARLDRAKAVVEAAA